MLVDSDVLIDAGTGIGDLGLEDLDSIRHVFLTHAHLDHIVGLTYLLDVLYGKSLERVTVHGAAEKLEAVRECLFSPLLFPVEPPFEARELGEGPTTLPGGGTLIHFPLKHPGGSLGFRFDWDDRSLAYVTDTTADPDADYVELIRGVDLLVHECNFRDELREHALTTGHSHTTPVAEVARKAGAGRLLLTHINPLTPEQDPINLDAARQIFPNTEIGVDNMEVEV